MAAASDKEREIHALILAKDDLAFAKFCDEYYETVFNKVKHFNPGIYKTDDTLLADVITDVFLKYFQQPERYHPEKQSLEYFLVMDAEGDLKNAWQKLKRQEKKFPNSVELDKKNGNSGIEDDEFDPFERLIDKEAGALLDKTLHSVFDSETDVLVAQLMLAGERRSSEYARVMNILHLPEETQQLQIKQQKDRVDKVIRRKLRNRNNDG
jgi:hypothetical protein